MADSLSDRLNAVLDFHTRRPVRVVVSMQTLEPGRTAYTITGLRPDDVQGEITRIFNRVADEGGLATFTNPYRTAEGYASRGEVMQIVAEAAE